MDKTRAWEDLGIREMRAILSLGDGESFEAECGAVWMRFVGQDLRDEGGILEDEFKVSPHGESMPDLESEWIDRGQVVMAYEEFVSKGKLKHE